MSLSKRTILRTTLIGAFLGLGAPLGYLFYSHFLLNPGQLPFQEWIRHVWRGQNLLLFYLTVPTILVFSAFGFINGLQKKRLFFRRQQMEEFLHIAAHDIRAPLAVMLGALEILQNKIFGELNEKQVNYVSMLQRQVGIMKELMDELLDLQRMEQNLDRLERKPSNLQALIEKAIEETGFLVTKKSGQVILKVEKGTSLDLLVGPFRMRQAIRNLVVNAAHFIAEGGHINVRVFQNAGEEIEVVIENDGPPIPADKLPYIFDKYVQAQSEQHIGSGLGLAICKNIMDLHRGHIWAENLSPRGVAFHLTLPTPKNDDGFHNPDRRDE